jgi:hypothetical protein
MAGWISKTEHLARILRLSTARSGLRGEGRIWNHDVRNGVHWRLRDSALCTPSRAAAELRLVAPTPMKYGDNHRARCARRANLFCPEKSVACLRRADSMIRAKQVTNTSSRRHSTHEVLVGCTLTVSESTCRGKQTIDILEVGACRSDGDRHSVDFADLRICAVDYARADKPCQDALPSLVACKGAGRGTQCHRGRV